MRLSGCAATGGQAPELMWSACACGATPFDSPPIHATLPSVLAAIMKALLADMGGSQWRVREAAAAATTDLLQGRRWPQLQPHFEQLWSMTLR